MPVLGWPRARNCCQMPWPWHPSQGCIVLRSSCPGPKPAGLLPATGVTHRRASRDSPGQPTRAHDNTRKRMIEQLSGRRALTHFMATVVALLVAGCGGGGGDDAAVAPAPYVAPVEPPAVTSVPAPVYEDARRAGAFKRLNEIRAAAGLGLLAQNKLIDAAAQAHSAYIITNGEALGHGETVGKPGFTGINSAARMIHAGYRDFDRSTEVAAALVISGVLPSQAGANLIDSLMGTPYHRNGILRPEYSEVGVGFYSDSSRGILTVDFGCTVENAQGAPLTVVSVWPPSDAVDVPTTMHPEAPNPIPENGVDPAGYSASVKVDGRYRSIDVTSFGMVDAEGNSVDTKLLSYETDPVLRGYYGDSSFAAALPRRPLEKNTRYTVTFVGFLILAVDGSRVPFTKAWSFTTGEKVWY